MTSRLTFARIYILAMADGHGGAEGMSEVVTIVEDTIIILVPHG